jgi:hypothetical protein
MTRRTFPTGTAALQALTLSSPAADREPFSASGRRIVTALLAAHASDVSRLAGSA